MTAKATTKANKLLEEAKIEKGEDLTKREVVQIAAPSYIPPIIMGLSTITCIFGANILNKQHQASLAAAYGVLDQYFKDYKKKVIEVHGEHADEKIVDSMAQDTYFGEKTNEKELFFDAYSRRYFEADIEDILKVECDINKMLVTEWGASLNDLYSLLGLPPKEEYEELGWSIPKMEEMYWHAWVEINHRKTVMEDGTECYILEIPLEPFIDYLEW